MKAFLYLLFAGWNLITGTDQRPAELAAAQPCITIIWALDADGTWRAFDPRLDPVVATSVGIEYLSPERSYWVWCSP